MDSLDGECTHVIQTRQEYEMLLNQRDRAKREKEEAERAAAREISRVKQEAAHEADRAAQRAQAQIDDLLQQVERKTAEIADQRALNANLLRISRERANADRGLRPKKVHTGYVVVMSSEKEIRYKTGRNMRAMDEHGKWLPKSRKVYDLDENGERIKLPSGRWKSHKEDKLLTAKVWETVLQSPYSVDFTESQARQLIEEDLLARKNGLLADVGITMICSGSSYENLIETENWKEIKAAHNTLFSRQLRANYRVGYWEYIIQHTKPLGIVPADMRAGAKNG